MKRGAAVFLCVGLLAAPAWAQGPSTTVGAEATVVTVGITITTLRDLDFGSVPKGLATTVLPIDANAGEWQVTGDKNARVSITFTLPTVLNNIQAAPGSTMPIAFSTSAARWVQTVNDPSGATPFDPNVGITARFPNPAAGPIPTIYLWLGGTVNPAAAAKPGIYTGTVIVSLVYL